MSSIHQGFLITIKQRLKSNRKSNWVWFNRPLVLMQYWFDKPAIETFSFYSRMFSKKLHSFFLIVFTNFENMIIKTTWRGWKINSLINYRLITKLSFLKIDTFSLTIKVRLLNMKIKSKNCLKDRSSEWPKLLYQWKIPRNGKQNATKG